MEDEKKSDDRSVKKTEIHDEDFEFVLKELLSAYQPILEEELSRAKEPEKLKEEVRAKPPSCEDELELADRLFDVFSREEVAVRLLDPSDREQLGDLKKLGWCIRHLGCCLKFGWLLYRARTFRAAVYYLNRYWICVRKSLGVDPSGRPLTVEERDDLKSLVQALAEVYKPFLAEQLHSTEFPGELAEEVITGKLGCEEGLAEASQIFDRFLTPERAPALFGKEAFELISQDPRFWLCRCWCLCTVKFGWCLARAKSLSDIVHCLLGYRRCLRRCFKPLLCEITQPAMGACAQTTFVAACAPLAGIQIRGTAAGATFNHYTLGYSWGGGPIVRSAVVYPNCDRPPAHPSSNVPVYGGILGYLDVTLLPPGVTEFTIYLDVYDAGTGHASCTQTFKVKTTAVEITAAAKVNALVAKDPWNPASSTKLIKAVNDPDPNVPELSIGGSFSVDGSAYVVGCDRIMTQFLLARFKVNPMAPVPTFPDATGGTPLIGPVVYDDIPGHPWQSGCWPIITPNTIMNGDLVAQWDFINCPFPVPHAVPKVKPLPFWNSAPLNGRFAILLEVRDRLLPAGPFPGDLAAVDQVTVWIDNQWPTASIKSIGGITGCGDLYLKDYMGATAEILGQAWDPPIDPTLPQKQPNDNFGSYGLGFQKDGGASGTIAPATPNVRVPNVWPGPLGAAVGKLADWDIVAALDGGPGPLPPGSEKLERGKRCAYVITLTVEDTTHVGDSGMHHAVGPVLYAINVINDIPP